jgi:hypothetical protein
MKDTDYNESEMLTKEHQRESRKLAQEKLLAIYDNTSMRTTVLATIDELNQYLQGNVTLEATTDAVRELHFSLLEVFVASLEVNNKSKIN